MNKHISTSLKQRQSWQYLASESFAPMYHVDNRGTTIKEYRGT